MSDNLQLNYEPRVVASAIHGKLPHITLGFWILKISATTLGETAGDLLSMTLNVGYKISTMILFSAFLILFFFQLLSTKFHPIL
jgi:uncharacterized membrane-anchored protein